jgi:hypothetical protein
MLNNLATGDHMKNVQVAASEIRIGDRITKGEPPALWEVKRIKIFNPTHTINYSRIVMSCNEIGSAQFGEPPREGCALSFMTDELVEVDSENHGERFAHVWDQPEHPAAPLKSSTPELNIIAFVIVAFIIVSIIHGVLS